MPDNSAPKIELLSEKKLVGKSQIMSFANNTTFELWRSFMPRRNEIKNSVGSALFSLEIFPENFFIDFNPSAEFEKWAATEVSDHASVPDNMQKLVVPEGLYAVFIHKGPASEGQRTYNYIFKEWLPSSKYTVDIRPHFALMGEKYDPNSPESEEEIWIPIKEKLV